MEVVDYEVMPDFVRIYSWEGRARDRSWLPCSAYSPVRSARAPKKWQYDEFKYIWNIQNISMKLKSIWLALLLISAAVTGVACRGHGGLPTLDGA
jgi:hypothetical protein